MNNIQNRRGRSQKMTPNNSNNNPSKRRPRKRRARPQAEQRRAYKWAMQDCTRHYLQALSDPFGLYDSNVPVCIPDITTIPSYKVATQNRATLHLGTAGVGFIFHHAGAYGSDSTNIWHSESSYAGTALAKSGTGVSTGTDTRFPYSSGGGLTVRPWRLVGSGLRIRYADTELNRGGSIVAWNNRDLDPNGSSEIDLLSVTGTVRHAPTRSWKTVAYVPHDPRSMDFSEAQYHEGEQYIGFMITGEPGSVYEWERVSFFELLPARGRTVPTTTSSDSDILGLSAVRNFLGHVNLEMFGPEIYQKGLRYITDTVLRSQGLPELTDFGL